MQTREGDAALDRAGREPDLDKLRARDDAVLCRGELRDRLLDMSRRTFGPNTSPNVRLVRHASMVARPA